MKTLAPLGSGPLGHPVSLCHHGAAKPKTSSVGKAAASPPGWHPLRSLRPQAAAPWRMLRPGTLCAAQQEQGYEMSVDEESMMRIAESLPPEDRSKALKLWEENKRMRTKLAILEGIGELPPRQRIRALQLLRENQSLRNQTGSLLATWEDLETTVTALMEAEEEALAANSTTTSNSTSNSSSNSTGSSSTGPSIADLLADGNSREAGTAEEQAVYDPSWLFWDTGLSSAGVQGLITSDAALALALNKTEAMVQTRDVDDILNNYWSTQLDVPPPPPLMEQQQQQQQFEALSSTADAEMATQRSPVAPRGAVASTGAPPEAQNPAQEAPAAPRPSVAAAPVQQPREIELEGAGGGLIGGRGVMAAAAGLGAGMLAIAAGLEAATAMEIMATTALVTSAGSLLGSNEAAQDLRRRGAGAPALVAIATALNAADTLTKTLDQALESERAKTMVRAADNAARMIAVVGKNAVSGVAGTVTGPTEAPSDDSLRPETIMGSAGRAVAAASVVESAEEAMAGFEEEDEQEIDDVDPQATSCLVVFSVEKEIPDGLCLKVVGTEEELGAWDGSLGAWDGSQGLSLHLKGASTWVGAAMVPLGASVEFTLATHVAGDEGGDVAWESVLGGSRRLQVDDPVAFVLCEWGNPESTEAEFGDAAMEQVESALQAIEDAKTGMLAPEAGSKAPSAPPPMMASAEVAGALEEALKLSTSAEENEKLDRLERELLRVREGRSAVDSPPGDSAAAPVVRDEKSGFAGAAEEEEGSLSDPLAALDPDAAEIALPGTTETAAGDTISVVEDALAEADTMTAPIEAVQTAAAAISESVGIDVPEGAPKAAVSDTTEAAEGVLAEADTASAPIDAAISESVGIDIPEGTAKRSVTAATEAVEAVLAEADTMSASIEAVETAAAVISECVGIDIPEGAAKASIADTTEAAESALAEADATSAPIEAAISESVGIEGAAKTAFEASASAISESVAIDVPEGAAPTTVCDATESVEAVHAEADAPRATNRMSVPVESAINPPGSIRIEEGANKSAASDTAAQAVLAEADTTSAPIEAVEASAAAIFKSGVAASEETAKVADDDTNEAVEAVLAEADDTNTPRQAPEAAEAVSAETSALVGNEKIADNSIVQAEESVSQADPSSLSGAVEIPGFQLGATEPAAPAAASGDATPAGGETTYAPASSSATGIPPPTGVKKEQQQDQRASLNASTRAEDATRADDDSSLLWMDQSLPGLPTEDESGNHSEELHRNAEAQGTAPQLLEQEADTASTEEAEAPGVNAQADNLEISAPEQSAGAAGAMGPTCAHETAEPGHGASWDTSDSLPEDDLANGSAAMMDENVEEKAGATVEEAADMPASPGPAEDEAAEAVMVETAARPEAAPIADSQSELTSVKDALPDMNVQDDAERNNALAEEDLVAPISSMLPRMNSMVPNRSPGELEDTNAFAMFLDALAAPPGEDPVQPAEAPVAGAESDEKVAAEIVAGSSATTARAVFAVKQELQFGQGMAVVGSCLELGNWDTAQAVVMTWHEGHHWVGESTIPCGSHEFKFVVTDGCSGDALYWETSGASNRIMQVPEGACTVFTEGEFGHMEESNVSVDDDLDARIAAAIMA